MPTTRECPFCKTEIHPDASVCPHCQRESEPWTENDGYWWKKGASNEWEQAGIAKSTPTAATGKERTAAVIVLVGVVLAAVGSFLPWLNITTAFGSASRNGMGGDGIIVLVVALVVGLIAVSRLGGAGIAKGANVFPLVGALLIIAAAIYDHLEVNERIESVRGDGVLASVGAGLWLLYLAGIVMAVGWWNGREDSQP